jgi:iron complex transport system ATP-binding protein
MTHTTGVVIDALSVQIGASRLLDAIDLDIAPGTVVGICGPNGSGKTTLLRCIHRAQRPQRGTVLIDGTDIADRSARELARLVGVVLQERSDDLDFTVRDMVSMGREPHKRFLDGFDRTDHRLVDDALDRVALQPLADRPFRTLSGGERQRALVARALAQQTTLLLLDEPTNHLDVRFQLETLELIRSLGITVIAALHDLQLAARFCDRIHLIERGRLVASGRPADVITTTSILEVFGVEAAIHEVGGRLFLDYHLPATGCSTCAPQETR